MSEFPDEVYHEDDPNASVTMPDGTVVTNKSPEEYWADYTDNSCSTIPEYVLEAALARLDEAEASK